ncbi:hypothetical protein TeGR_g10790 [Tetraparma gracilis]|uniref:Amino acid transporter transmembrane domain-containing protein n=1 Tax=Tetraparma gracilis TaxID=2962635 RepID=A0ABQ6MYR1_9STRA|nr:hypothetical protein TeGR_g10790 [Tetraparma gracilis]
MDHGLSTFQSISLTVNILLGSGFFAIPLAVQQTSILSTLLVTVVVFLLMTYTCISEASYVLLTQTFLASSKPPEVTIVAKTLSGRKFELTYLSVLSISIFGAMISYTMLFADSLTSIITGSQNTSHDSPTYLLCVLAFTLITTPISLAKVEEQVWLQTFSFYLRCVLLTIMSATPLVAKFLGRLETSFPSIVDADVAAAPSFSTAFTGLLGTISFSLFLNSTLPTMLDTCKDRKKIGFITAFSMFLVSALIFMLGVCVAVAFGDKTVSPANLLWTSYQLPLETCGGGCKAASKVIEVLILFFPALDVLSIYSVNCIIITNNVMEGIWGVNWRGAGGGEGGEAAPLMGGGGGGGGGGEAGKGMAGKEKWVLAGVNVAPILVALLLPGFSKAIVFTGGISLLLCLVFPAYLAIRAGADEWRGYKDEGLADSWWNIVGFVDSDAAQYVVLVLGSILTAVILINTMILA